MGLTGPGHFVAGGAKRPAKRACPLANRESGHTTIEGHAAFIIFRIRGLLFTSAGARERSAAVRERSPPLRARSKAPRSGGAEIALSGSQFRHS